MTGSGRPERDVEGRFVGEVRRHVRSVPCLPARVLAQISEDPRQLRYMLFWSRPAKGFVPEQTLVAEAFPLGEGVRVELEETGEGFLIPLFRRSAPNGGHITLAACWRCGRRVRLLYRSPEVAGWLCQKDAGVSSRQAAGPLAKLRNQAVQNYRGNKSWMKERLRRAVTPPPWKGPEVHPVVGKGQFVGTVPGPDGALESVYVVETSPALPARSEALAVPEPAPSQAPRPDPADIDLRRRPPCEYFRGYGSKSCDRCGAPVQAHQGRRRPRMPARRLRP